MKYESIVIWCTRILHMTHPNVIEAEVDFFTLLLSSLKLRIDHKYDHSPVQQHLKLIGLSDLSVF